MPLVASSVIGSKDAHSRKVKFMCSHAGKIVPRPSDRKLRYAGGETRMISLPRHIRYSAFVKKMTEMYGPDLAVKYQLPGEDLDALVSVSCDEDLENMMDECDRLEFNDGSLKLRVFISSQYELEDTDLNDMSDPLICERRYVNAVNALPDEATFWKQDDCVPKDLSKSAAVCAGQVYQVQEKAATALDDPLFEGLPLSKPKADHPPMSSGLVADFVSNTVPSTLGQGTHPFVNKRLDISCSHGPFAGTEDSAAEVFTPIASPREELYQQSTEFHQPHLPQNEVQNGSMLLSDGLLVGNGEALATFKEGMLVHLGSADMPYVFESVEDSNRFDNWEHGDFLSSPGASLQKQLEGDDGLSERPTVNESMQRSQSDGWYTQQHVFHQHERRAENNLFDRTRFHDPWPSSAEENEQAGSTDEGLPSQMPASRDLKSFARGSSSSSLEGTFVSSTSPREHINVDGNTAQGSHNAFNAALPDLESTKLLNDRHWGNISFLDSDSLYGDISNPVFQTCHTTLASSRGLHGSTLPQRAPVADLSDQNSNPFHDHDGGWHRDKALHFDTQISPYPFSLPQENISDRNHYLHGESIGVGDRFSNIQPTVTMPSVTSEQQSQWVSDPPLFDESIAQHRDMLADAIGDSVSQVKVDPPSAVDNVSIMDMISDLLQSTQLKECLPAETSMSMGSLDNLNAHDKEKLTPPAPSRALDATTYMNEVPVGTSDELQDMQTVETILSRLGHPISTVTQLDAFDEEVGFHNQENLERDEVFSALASLHSYYETEPENWHVEIQHTLQDASLVLERKVAFEETKPDEENADAFDSMSDSYVNTAAIAEAEAKAHGLQIIKNADLEELRELGSGTFGTVYHGKWRGTDVAIKRIKSSCFMGKPTERERLIADFLREAYILGQLHHPNVVAFYGIVPDGPLGTLATVTEYMVNGSLKQVLVKKERTLDRRKRLLIAMDAAFGMEYLHGKNVVHFDLKCENLLVNLKDIQRPICKVADLGLSKVKKQTMVSGGVRGTLPWMAPELLSGSSSLVSEKIDVFSFGIVMWELLTGEEPYANMHYGAIIGGIVNNTLRPPVPRWCDAAWRSLMEKCWAADPFERPTFSHIAASLRAMEASIGAKGHIPSSLL